MKRPNEKRMLLLLAVSACAFGLLVLPDLAHAAGAGGGGMPWDKYMTDLSGSFSGTIARTLAICGIVVAGGVLVFGGDLSQGGRTAVGVVFVAAVALNAVTITDKLSAQGASIGESASAAPYTLRRTSAFAPWDAAGPLSTHRILAD